MRPYGEFWLHEAPVHGYLIWPTGTQYRHVTGNIINDCAWGWNANKVNYKVEMTPLPFQNDRKFKTYDFEKYDCTSSSVLNK